jgi:hypothetical protein
MKTIRTSAAAAALLALGACADASPVAAPADAAAPLLSACRSSALKSTTLCANVELSTGGIARGC